MDVHVGATEAPDDDPFPELLPEVLPGPEVLPEHAPEVLRVPLSLHRLLDRAKPSMAEAASLAALVLAALADMHDAGDTHGGLDSRSVRLTPDCRVHVAGRRRARERLPPIGTNDGPTSAPPPPSWPRSTRRPAAEPPAH